MHKRMLMLALGLFYLPSCQNSVEEKRALPAWAQVLEQEAVRLTQERPVVRLEQTVLGKQEITDTNGVAWENVYAFFLEAALPPAVMETGYRLETKLGTADSTLQWTALRTNRRPQQLRIVYARAHGTVIGVQIENETNNVFYKSTQSLRYAKGDSILIEGMNKLPWQKKKRYQQLIYFRQ